MNVDSDFVTGYWALIAAGILLGLLFAAVLIRHFTGERPRPSSGDGNYGLQVTAWLLIFGGIGGIVYFFLFFDTSIAVEAQAIGVSRVNNLGLMQDRQNGIIISAVALIIGVLLALFGKRSHRL